MIEYYEPENIIDRGEGKKIIFEPDGGYHIISYHIII